MTFMNKEWLRNLLQTARALVGCFLLPNCIYCLYKSVDFFPRWKPCDATC
jgi:hypothetical protein